MIAAAALAACTADPLPLVPPGLAPTPALPAPAEVREVVVGVDELTPGFNPHTLADLTPLTTAIAGLVLPSAFQQRPDGEWALDETLLTSAEVTDTAPFTVTYRIRHDAQWSDTAPIAAEDFGYLAEQMRSQPGVVDSAGYQLIDRVVSRDGGKIAEVVFLKPYPAWRTLFRHLLPAHLLKDAPGGWSRALDGGLLVSGGPFVMTSFDPDRGELLLTRNDRYWDTPAEVDRILLREGSDGARIEALPTGGAQAALFAHPDAITETLLAEAGLDRAAVTVAQPIVVSVLLRRSSTVLRDPRVRTAVAAALDRSALIATGVGSGPSEGLRADSLLYAPSDPDYRAGLPEDAPVHHDPALMRRLLTERGYTHGPDGWQRGGTPLSLVVAAPADRQPYELLATRVAEQLRDAGIRVELRSIDPDELFGTLLAGDDRPGQRRGGPGSATSGVDIAVVPQPTAGDPASQVESWFGCPLVVPARLPAAPANPAGLCDLDLQPSIEQALSGRTELLTALEPALWRTAVTVPLYQQAGLLVSTGTLTGVRAGTPLEGPFHGAERWKLRG